MPTLRERNGRWYLAICQNGRRQEKAVGGNARLAELRLQQARVDIERGKAGFPVIERKTLSGRLEDYIANHSQGKAPRTVVRYREMARTILGHCPGDVDLDAAGLRRYIDARLTGGVRSKTVNNELVFIRSVYSDHGPGSHPFRCVKNLPLRDSKEIRYLTGDEPGRLLAACAAGINRSNWPDLADYVAGYLYTGVRLAELDALRWQDVTPQGVRVTNLKTHGKKRGDRYRLVPIHPALALILGRRRAIGGLPIPFPPHHPNSLRRAVSRAAERAGIAPGVGVHSLRHTFAVELRLRGVGLDVIGRLLGHTSIETTMIYAHVQPESLDAAVSLLRY